MPWVLIPLTAIICIFGLPIYFHHKKAMLELQIKAGNTGDSQLVSQLQSLQNQIAELRDTTTRYDMSFDSALQRLESRMANVESRTDPNIADREQAFARRTE